MRRFSLKGAEDQLVGVTTHACPSVLGKLLSCNSIRTYLALGCFRRFSITKNAYKNMPDDYISAQVIDYRRASQGNPLPSELRQINDSMSFKL